MLRQTPHWVINFIRWIRKKPPKITFSYPPYVLTAGEIRRRLNKTGFIVESFYPYFLYIPALMHNERWLHLLFKLGQLYPMLARFGMFIARKEIKN